MMSESYRNFKTINSGKVGDIDVIAWRMLDKQVHVAIDNGAIDFGFDLKPDVARALAAQLIAAADYAEGGSNA